MNFKIKTWKNTPSKIDFKQQSNQIKVKIAERRKFQGRGV